MRVRMDAGYFAAEIARECLFRGVEFAIGAKRNPAVWRAAAAIPDHIWVPAIDMDHGEVAVCDYVPDWWPADAVCLVRRVRIPVEQRDVRDGDSSGATPLLEAASSRSVLPGGPVSTSTEIGAAVRTFGKNQAGLITVSQAAAVAVAFLFALAALSVAGTARAATDTALAPAANSGYDTPVGVWKGTVYRADGPHNTALAFCQNGDAFITNELGTTTKGTWAPTGANRFRYHFVERVYDANGTYIGYVDVNQDAVQSGESFTSSGESYFYNPNGNFVGSGTVTFVMNRVSTK